MAERNKPLPRITRERLQAAKAIRNLEWVEDQLRTRYRELDLGGIPALKEYAAIQRWKIDKVLPELKAVEHTGQVEVTHTIAVKVS